MREPIRLFEPITRQQNRLIHAFARSSELSDRHLYSMVEEQIGIPSISALSRQEASCLIRRMKTGQRRCFFMLRAEGWIPRHAYRLPNYRHILAIRLMARDMGWSKDHLKNWLKKYVKAASIAELDRESARKAFLGLMQIRRRAQEKIRAEVNPRTNPKR